MKIRKSALIISSIMLLGMTGCSVRGTASQIAGQAAGGLSSKTSVFDHFKSQVTSEGFHTSGSVYQNETEASVTSVTAQKEAIILVTGELKGSNGKIKLIYTDPKGNDTLLGEAEKSKDCKIDMELTVAEGTGDIHFAGDDVTCRFDLLFSNTEEVTYGDDEEVNEAEELEELEEADWEEEWEEEDQESQSEAESSYFSEYMAGKTLHYLNITGRVWHNETNANLAYVKAEEETEIIVLGNMKKSTGTITLVYADAEGNETVLGEADRSNDCKLDTKFIVKEGIGSIYFKGEDANCEFDVKLSGVSDVEYKATKEGFEKESSVSEFGFRDWD